jgi:collagenase-like PrtC family protease
MPNYFMVGNNFDEKLIDEVININKQSTNFNVKEMYGSTTSTFPQYTARPLYRLPDKTLIQTMEIKKTLEEHDILFNLTMNGPNIDKTKFDAHGFIKFLDDWKIKRITVTSTLLLEVLQQSDLDIGIELSTIYHINSLYQMETLLQRYPKIKKVCMNLQRNRDMKFLKEFNKVFGAYIDVEVMVNEFCLYHCPNRNACYMNHQNVKTVEESKMFSNYPMRDCIYARATDFAEWLKTRFILPEWLKYYNDIGINHFKITGRTSSTDFILKVLKIYLGAHLQYRFGELWYHLENIGNTKENKFTPDLLTKIGPEHLKEYEEFIFYEQQGLDIENNHNDMVYYNGKMRYFADKIMRMVDK